MMPVQMKKNIASSLNIYHAGNFSRKDNPFFISFSDKAPWSSVQMIYGMKLKLFALILLFT